MKIFNSRAFLFLAIGLLSLVCVNTQASEDSDRFPGRLIILSAGDFGVDDDLDRPTFVGIDYRSVPFSKWNLIPALGYVYKDGGAHYVFLDLRYDYWFSDNWVLIPSYGVGIYDRDSEVDLGGSLEFRAGLEISRQFDNNARAGLSIFHLSNGKVYGTNPGTEAIGVTVSIPIDR
ncbi:MAG: acyloxyacyl hydrolase [Gammaproteobacteria bacterium]|nr:acyloxyacyl hydrolase [Gammaproteobacteria bacterium]